MLPKVPRYGEKVWKSSTDLASATMSCTKACSGACSVGRQQVSLATYLLRDDCLRHIVVTVWAVTFGGNMQSPAIPYFYLEIGMSAVEIGNTGFIIMAFLLVSGPVYGYVLDRKGAHEALLLSLGGCGGACLARGTCACVDCAYVYTPASKERY